MCQENNYNNQSGENRFPWDDSANPTPPVNPKPRKPFTWSAGKVIALALCCALAGGLLGTGGALLVSGSHSNPVQSSVYEGKREHPVLNTTRVDTDKKMSAAEVYAQNVNSTVGITTSITTNFWGYQTTSAASGSGFILTKDGYILTNHHVIEGSNSITVSLYDGTTYDATLIGYDIAYDIAVLKVDAKDLIPVVLGSSDDMFVGDDVLAIGNPLGELTFSLTSGAISALDREITMGNGGSMNLIQTDCAINSGNSGGALFNLYGEVVGITNAKYSGNSSSGATIDNIGFAIPIDDVREIVKSIIEKGYVSKPYIGVTVTNVSPDAQALGLPEGAAVRTVVADGPAFQAGLQQNDIITKINGTKISGSSQLVKVVSDCKVGDVLKLEIFRKGETSELSLTVGERIKSALESPQGGQLQLPG